MKVALIQFNASADKSDNIRRALEFVKEAVAHQARWILLPEIFSFRGDIRSKEVLSQIRECIPGPTTQTFLDFACRHKRDLLLGSVLEQAPGDKAYNTSVAISGSLGRIVKYRKIHLFDAVLGDKIIRESDFLAKGRGPQTVSVGGFKVALSVCYDLRFPDLYQSYARQKATVLSVPSCFTKTTGQAHWEILLRARAIENLCYVLAPNQVGKDARGIEAYGHSMIVSPWGDVIACGSPEGEEIIYGEISVEAVKEARTKLPGIVKG